MTTPKKTSYILGITFYTIGLVLCLLIASSSVMADIEAEFYGFDELSKGRFSTLRCPAVLNKNETGTVRVSITNTLDRSYQSGHSQRYQHSCYGRYHTRSGFA